MKCPCHSTKEYSECCAPFHQGTLPATAEQLMRSRFCAYSMGNVDYILETTHPKHVDQKLPIQERRAQIEAFYSQTAFDGLEILEHLDTLPFAYVTFQATLKQGEYDVSFTEKSRFEKIEGKWYYLDGTFID